MRPQSIERLARADSFRSPGGMRTRLFAALAAMVLVPCAVAQQAGELAKRTIQVAPLGNGPSADALRQRVIGQLNRSGRLKVVAGSAAADFVLRGTSGVWTTGTIAINPRAKSESETIYTGYLSVELVNKDQQTVWSYLVTPSRFRIASITDDLADHMAARLLEALNSAGKSNAKSALLPGAGIESSVALHAAGSTLAAPLYREWFQSAGVPVTYDAVGSEAGIEKLAVHEVDFAASDMPLTGGDVQASLEANEFPTVLGGVAPIYNLPGLGRELRLTPAVLAGIYSGAIRKWNDPRILEANHGAHLPDAEIAVVHRSDGSGTTFVWTSFLSLTSAEWKTRAGAGARVNWPVGVGATGSEGVAELVKNTPNAIGYVDLIYAIQHELNYAAVQNPAGVFIKADLASITAAAGGANVTRGGGFRFSILNAPSRDAYPISTFTWLLLPEHGLSREKRTAIASLLGWALTSGQKQCSSLGYAPLPREIVASELQAVDAWKNKE